MEAETIHELGQKGEKSAVRFLKKEGYDTVYPLPFDILAIKDKKYFGVEVKTRTKECKFDKWILKPSQIKGYQKLDLPMLVILVNNGNTVMKSFNKLMEKQARLPSKFPEGNRIAEKTREKVIVALRSAYPKAMSRNGIRGFASVHQNTLEKLLAELKKKGCIEEIEISGDGVVFRWVGK